MKSAQCKVQTLLLNVPEFAFFTLHSALCNSQPASLLAVLALFGLPAVQSRSPGQTSAKTAHQQHITRFDPSGLLGFVETDGDRSG